jgi:hypothetical protein
VYSAMEKAPCRAPLQVILYEFAPEAVHTPSDAVAVAAAVPAQLEAAVNWLTDMSVAASDSSGVASKSAKTSATRMWRGENFRDEGSEED